MARDTRSLPRPRGVEVVEVVEGGEAVEGVLLWYVARDIKSLPRPTNYGYKLGYSQSYR